MIPCPPNKKTSTPQGAGQFGAQKSAADDRDRFDFATDFVQTLEIRDRPIQRHAIQNGVAGLFDRRQISRLSAGRDQAFVVSNFRPVFEQRFVFYCVDFDDLQKKSGHVTVAK